MIIEPYRFLEPLGRGSFGEVWRVEYAKPGQLQGKQFAAKLSYLPAEHEEITREMVEFGPILTERHPHILQLFSAESCFDGRLLLVMELASGSLLDRWRRSQAARPPIQELALYIRQAAAALDHIHSLGLIHGGINPGDILILNDQAKIADPGPPISPRQPIVKSRVANLSKAICMAPEREHGIRHFQNDQYALAASYVWLRVGYPLDFSVRPAEFHLHTAISPPEQEVLAKALSLEPESRYSSCAAFASDLQHAAVSK